MQSLFLRLVVSPSVDEDGKPAREGFVYATVGNRKLGSADVPIALHCLLAYRGLSGPTEVLTCNCGVAGCAGFHADVIQTWADDVVSWNLDEEEYRAWLPGLPLDPARPGTVLLRVATRSVERAIDDLYAQLRAALAEGPLHLLPGHRDLAVASMDELEESFVASREWFLAQREREALDRELFGPFDSAVVVARFPGGEVKHAHVRALVKDILFHEADDAGVTLQRDAQVYVDDKVRTKWRPLLEQGGDELLDNLRSRVWEDLSAWFWTHAKGEKEDLAQAWSKAELSICDAPDAP